MLTVFQKEMDRNVYFFTVPLDQVGPHFGRSFGLSLEKGKHGGWEMDVLGQGIIFLLNSVDLSGRTPRKRIIPVEWDENLTGYKRVNQILSTNPDRAGIVVHVSNENVVWVNEREKGIFLLEDGESVEFVEGSLLVK